MTMNILLLGLLVVAAYSNLYLQLRKRKRRGLLSTRKKIRF